MNSAPLILGWIFISLLPPTYVSPKGIDVYVNPPPCTQDQTAIRLHVTNIKRVKGSLVVDVHSDVIEDFLADDKVILRVRQKVNSHDMNICVPVPEPGNYALAVYQDKDNDRKFDKNFLGIPSERFGLSGNPKYSRKKPRLINSIFPVEPTGTEQTIRLVSASEI